MDCYQFADLAAEAHSGRDLAYRIRIAEKPIQCGPLSFFRDYKYIPPPEEETPFEELSGPFIRLLFPL